MQCRRPWFNSSVGKFPLRRDRLPTPVFLGFPGGSDGKESACNAEYLSSVPGFNTWVHVLKEGMATHSRILPWRLATDRGAWGLQSMRSQRVGHDWVTKSSRVQRKGTWFYKSLRPASRSWPGLRVSEKHLLRKYLEQSSEVWVSVNYVKAEGDSEKSVFQTGGVVYFRGPWWVWRT